MRVASNAPLTLFQTAIFYGVYGSGKTQLCATFPRVAWFGSFREGGYKTIQAMDSSLFYEPKIPPEIFPIGMQSPAAEIMGHLNKDVTPLILKGTIQTIVFELSFYAEDFIKLRASEETWQKYADLETNIMHIDTWAKKYPTLRIVYNALANVENDGKKPSGPLLPGRAVSKKLPAICDVVGYLRTEDSETGDTDRILHMSPISNFPARHRYGVRFPKYVRNPTYRLLEDLFHKRAVCDEKGNIIYPEKTLTALPPLR